MNYETYLEHNGILGQKWGVRRYQNADGSLTAAGRKRYNDDGSRKSSLTRRLEKTYNRQNADVRSFDAITEDLKYTRGKLAGKTFYSVADAKRDQEVYRKMAEETKQKLDASRAKDRERQERRDAIDKTYKDIDKNASIKEKFVFNNATRKLAAKYVVDNNMTYEEASKKSKQDAIRNTAIFMGVYGAYTIGMIYAINH